MRKRKKNTAGGRRTNESLRADRKTTPPHDERSAAPHVREITTSTKTEKFRRNAERDGGAPRCRPPSGETIRNHGERQTRELRPRLPPIGVGVTERALPRAGVGATSPPPPPRRSDLPPPLSPSVLAARTAPLSHAAASSPPPRVAKMGKRPRGAYFSLNFAPPPRAPPGRWTEAGDPPPLDSIERRGGRMTETEPPEKPRLAPPPPAGPPPPPQNPRASSSTCPPPPNENEHSPSSPRLRVILPGPPSTPTLYPSSPPPWPTDNPTPPP